MHLGAAAVCASWAREAGHAAQREAWSLGHVEEWHGPMHERQGRRVSVCARSSLSVLCELARL